MKEPVGMPTCWAYNKERIRCTDVAGHAGMHNYTVQWADDECYDPTLTAGEYPLGVIEVPRTQIKQESVYLEDEVDEHSKSCVLCGHPYHESTCVVSVQGPVGSGACDCLTCVT